MCRFSQSSDSYQEETRLAAEIWNQQTFAVMKNSSLSSQVVKFNEVSEGVRRTTGAPLLKYLIFKYSVTY